MARHQAAVKFRVKATVFAARASIDTPPRRTVYQAQDLRAAEPSVAPAANPPPWVLQVNPEPLANFVTNRTVSASDTSYNRDSSDTLAPSDKSGETPPEK